MISKLLKKNEKGFTLMEMLIVVAIIAVLVAIAIPTFNSSLNKAKVATDTANMRAGYAAVMVEVIDKTPAADTTYCLKSDGTVVVTKDSGTAVADAYQTQGKQGTKTSIGGIVVNSTSGTWEQGKYVTYKYVVSDQSVQISTTDTQPQA